MKFTLSLILLLCLLLAPTMAARADAGQPFPPPGFEPVLSDVGVELYRKDYPKGNPDFVQVVHLDQGAAVELMHADTDGAGQAKGMFGGNSPKFLRLHLEDFWYNTANANPTPFCVTNGQFFFMQEYPSGIAFPLKKDGQVISEGYGVNEYPGNKLMLELWPGRAEIRELTEENFYASDAPDILGGLTEVANKRGKFYVGRTFLGIDDTNGDGLFETLFVFNTKSARQVDAAEVLRSFGADKVMMLDGGGSTQLICKGDDIIPSDRLIPQALAVLAGTGAPPEAALLAAAPTQALTVTESLENVASWPVLQAGGAVEAPAKEENKRRDTKETKGLLGAIEGWLERSGQASEASAQPSEPAASSNASSAAMTLRDIVWIPVAMSPPVTAVLLVVLKRRRAVRMPGYPAAWDGYGYEGEYGYEPEGEPYPDYELPTY